MSTKPAVPSTKSAITVAPKQSPPKSSTAKDNGKMHRRSRSGCFTCRLRRKKCDEGKGLCRACRHLGLSCEYKRPIWWSNAEQRKQMKEDIKNVIKQTKTNEKLAHQMAPAHPHAHVDSNTPPGLSHSLPTSATYSVTTCTRPPSVGGSPHSPYYDFGHPPQGYNPFEPIGHPHVVSPPFENGPYCHPYPQTPYEVDIKTERETYVDDIPTRKDSSTSTFSTYHPPPGVDPFSSRDEWIQDSIFENPDVFSCVQGPEYELFPHAPAVPLTTSESAQINVDECDRPLLDHFLEHVLRLTLPILEVTCPGSAKTSTILPALATNKTYLHCCLSVAAIHLKSTQKRNDEAIDEAIVRNRVECVSGLCSMLNNEQQQVLEATLGMIVFPCSVGGTESDQDVPDIAWYDHFEAVNSLVRRLQLQHAMEQVDGAPPRPPFNMSLTAWIDILGSTMVGRSPIFADTYREKNEAGATCGLLDLMGCDDRVMYMISEIACLDALKRSGAIDELQICELVQSLGMHLDATESRNGMESAISVTGALRPDHLVTNITNMFRLAARIYLCSLVPNADRHQESMCTLLERFVTVMEFIPAGPEGFDRSLVWPLLIAGSMTTPGSRLRQVLEERFNLLGEHGMFGSFGRMVCLLREVWQRADGAEQTPGRAEGDVQNVHWRDVMQQKGWNYLLL